MKKKLEIPKFKNEDEERDFWNKIDLSEYFESSDFKKASFPDFKLPTETISLRLPWRTLDEIKIMANKRDVPYQSFIKVILHERIEKEKRALTKLDA